MAPQRSSLTAYRAGLAVLGVFTIVLVVMVLVQAGASKHDTEVYDSATKIADRLNTYIDDHQTIPASLHTAGVSDVPADVSYTKLSASAYKFCVTYKADSDDFDASSVATSLATGGTTERFGTSTSGDDSSLYLSPSHHKGANCQTIKPYLASSDSLNDYYEQLFNSYSNQDDSSSNDLYQQ